MIGKRGWSGFLVCKTRYITRNSTNDEQNIIININYNLWNYSLITVNSAVTTEVTTSP